MVSGLGKILTFRLTRLPRDRNPPKHLHTTISLMAFFDRSWPLTTGSVPVKSDVNGWLSQCNYPTWPQSSTSAQIMAQ